MRRLLIVFALLIAFAILMAAVTIFLSPTERSFGGPKVLLWKLDAPLVDYSEAPDLQIFRRHSPRGLASIYRRLAHARGDESVRGIALYLQVAQFGFGKAQELRTLLQSLAVAGKSVDCYLETVGEGSNGTLAYYLATACQHITLSPLGELNTVGLYSDSAFIRGTLDKLRIEPQFRHVGEYKSAAEFYTESEHSPAAERALGAVLDDLFEQIVEAIAAARGLDPGLVRQIIDRAPLSADAALELGLVDEISYPEVFEDRLVGNENGGARIVPLAEYSPTSAAFNRPRVAVVFAQGTIVRGWNGTDPWSSQRYIGADSMREILRQLGDESAVSSIVLRVDSPGGSPVASDLILHELELLASRKPVVVSMSDVAASGGYYISSKAAKIVAAPASITGSIGVVGGKLVTRRFQQDLLGVSHDTLTRGENADFYSSLEPFSAAQEAQFQALMERIYSVFVGHVVDGRNLSREEVERLAGGRIWTGRQAKELGLVDEVGGMDRAIALALEAANLDPATPVGLDFYPRPPGILELLTRSLAPLMGGRHSRSPILPRFQAPHALELPAEILRLLQLSAAG